MNSTILLYALRKLSLHSAAVIRQLTEQPQDDKKFFRGPLPKLRSKQRIVIIGAGPTGLGAAYRLFENLFRENGLIEVLILEKEQKAGGLASSYRDDKGFLWDNGGHVVFSHYSYFDRLLKKAVKGWNHRSRASFAYMMGSSGNRSFIPYPVQHNIQVFDKEEQQESLKGLEKIQAHPILAKPQNFDEWLLKNFGEGLSEVFMRSTIAKCGQLIQKK